MDRGQHDAFQGCNDDFVNPLEEDTGSNDVDTKNSIITVPFSFPQIVVNKMPRHSKKKDFEKFLDATSIKYRKCKVVSQKNLAFIYFDNEQDCQAAISALHGIMYRKSMLEIAIRNSASNNENNKKRAVESPVDEIGWEKRPKHMTENEKAETPIKTAKDAVSPWWNVPYDEQLARKTADMAKDCLCKCFREVSIAYSKWNKSAKWDGRKVEEVPSWIADNQAKSLSWIEYRPIIASPEQTGYRNKCEFTFGVDSADRLPALGFRVSTFREGVLVGTPGDCPNVCNAMKVLVREVNRYLREITSLKVYDMQKHCGVWRLLTVRYSKRTKQMTVLLCVSLKNVESGTWDAELERLTSFIRGITRTIDTDCETMTSLNDDESKELVGSSLVTSLCYQVYDGLSVPSMDHEIISIYGEDAIVERMNNCAFRVSPQAFFQVNTPCAELLYYEVMKAMRGSNAPKVVDKLSSPEDNSNLLCLDVCSGTGTIGICCAKASMGHVIGVELCQPAVDDAVDNAIRNGLKLFTHKSSSTFDQKVGEEFKAGATASGINEYECGFICSRAETVLESLIGNARSDKSGISLVPFQNMARGKKVLAVVDPPREGLHVDCLRAIRNCARIERLVYVSCNPTKSLPRDVAMLCGPANKKLYGQAFRPVAATPVDLFPHTPHCEMLLVMER